MKFTLFSTFALLAVAIGVQAKVCCQSGVECTELRRDDASLPACCCYADTEAECKHLGPGCL